jgi:hypothetical protein
MWIRKSATEVKSDRGASRRRNYLTGVGLLLLVCAIASSRPGWSLPAGVRIFAAIFTGIILLAWLQRRRGSRARSTVQVCDRCNSVKISDGRTDCACGGIFVPLEAMKWVDSPGPRAERPPADPPVVASPAA